MTNLREAYLFIVLCNQYNWCWKQTKYLFYIKLYFKVQYFL